MAFCSNCGTRLGEGYSFCPECGAKVGPAPVTPNNQEDTEPTIITPKEPTPVKHRPKWLIPAIAGVLIIALAAAAFFVLPGLMEDDRDYTSYTDTDGNVHFIYDDGTVETIEGDYETVFKSKYLKKYIILEDGELYLLNFSMKNRKDITDSCDKLCSISDNYIVFTRGNNTVIYNVKTGESVKAKGIYTGSLHYAREELKDDSPVSDLFFATEEGGLWHFTAEDFKVEQLDERDNLNIIYSSRDCSLMFYSSLSGTTDSLFRYENGKCKEIDSCELDNTYYEHTYSEYYICSSYNDTFAVLGNSNSDKIFMVCDSEYEPVNIYSAYSSSARFDGANSLYDYRGEEIPDGVYLTSYRDYGTYEGDCSCILWYVGFDGKAEEVAYIAGITFGIFGDTIYYCSAKNELSCGTLSGNSIKNSGVIDDGVLYIMAEGDSMYYLKDCEVVNDDQSVGKGCLYRINPDLKKPVLVDDETACYYSAFDYSDGDKYEFGMIEWPGVSTENSILTYHDYEYIDYDKYFQEATLTVCDKNGNDIKELEKVISYVSITFNNGNTIFEQYVKTESDKYVADLYMFDGKAMWPLVEGVWSIRS